MKVWEVEEIISPNFQGMFWHLLTAQLVTFLFRKQHLLTIVMSGCCFATLVVMIYDMIYDI